MARMWNWWNGKPAAEGEVEVDALADPPGTVALVEDPRGPEPNRLIRAFLGAGGILVAADTTEQHLALAKYQRSRRAVLRAVDAAPIANLIPALRVERQRDLSNKALEALVGVEAVHRALVITPREAIDVDPPRCPTCGHFDWVVGEEPGGPFCREHGDEMTYGSVIDPCAIANRSAADLVIVRGAEGPDAWPLNPQWVREIRTACADAGVAFAFMGWGRLGPQVFFRGDKRSHIQNIDDPGLTLCGRLASVPEPDRGMDGRCCGTCRNLYEASVPGDWLDGKQHFALPEGM